MTKEQIAEKTISIASEKIFNAGNPKTIWLDKKITEAFDQINEALQVKPLCTTFLGIEMGGENSSITVYDQEVLDK